VGTLSQVEVTANIVGTVAASVVLVLPGWVFVTVLNRGVRESQPGERQMLLEITFAGVLIHLLAIAWTLRVGREVLAGPQDHAAELAAWVVVVFVLLPAALGLTLAAAAAWADRRRQPWVRSVLARVGLAESSRMDSAWILSFRQQRGAVFVKVHMRDGSIVGGRFSHDSGVAANPERRDLYLETLWHLDARGWFRDPYPNSSGVWINGADITRIEFHEEVG
jgi:hypothetical protein